MLSALHHIPVPIIPYSAIFTGEPDKALWFQQLAPGTVESSSSPAQARPRIYTPAQPQIPAIPLKNKGEDPAEIVASGVVVLSLVELSGIEPLTSSLRKCC
jgi:hypothetical protein